MRQTFLAATALGLAFICGGARAQEAPTTVLDYATAMNASAQRIDGQVAERQRAGDMAAAQRLVLAAAMVRRAAEEFRGAEQDNQTDPVASLPAPVPRLADAALAKAAEAETRAADHAAFAEEAHVTFNALLAAMPQKRAHPVLYGMLSADLAEAASPLDHDIVIYGYRLIDPYLKTATTVIYGKTEIDPARVEVKDDRIGVTLPDTVKKAVRFAPSPCEQRPSFGLRVRDYFSEPHGLWPILWRSQGWTNTDFFALATPVIYSAAIEATAETTSASRSTVTFRQRSSLAVADCDQTKSAEILFPLPENARNATCSASWVDAAHTAKTISRCVVEGRNVRAYGEISGGSKICSPEKLCTCSIQAQGWLEASGAYEIDETASAVQVAADWPPLSFPTGGVAEGRVTVGDGRKLRHVTLNLTRRGCSTPVDSIDLSIGDDADAKSTGVSKTGAFRASLQGGALTVGAADAVAASGYRTP